jgi:hypothetical protein
MSAALIPLKKFGDRKNAGAEIAKIFSESSLFDGTRIVSED